MAASVPPSIRRLRRLRARPRLSRTHGAVLVARYTTTRAAEDVSHLQLRVGGALHYRAMNDTLSGEAKAEQDVWGRRILTTS